MHPLRRLVRAIWDEPPPPHVPPRGWRDWAIVAFFGVVTLLEALLKPELPYRVPTLIIGVGLVPTLLWRRSRPLPMILIVSVVTGLASPIIGGEPRLNSMVYILVLLYALVRWGSGRAIVLAATAMVLKVAWSMAFGYLPSGNAVGGLLVFAGVGAVGTAFRYRARARSRELDQVKLLERERLARDLHDTVAHHVSAMAIRAQAGIAVSQAEPEAAVDALRLIEAEATRALAEMRTMVRMLRQDEPAALTPNPLLSDVEQLAGQARTGPPVHVRLEGDVEVVAPTVGTAVYRLAQESVTNARRHARHATTIEVLITVDESSVVLKVTDDGAESTANPDGYGLVGMRERAALLGGVCEAGPDPAGGWAVTATLPRAGAGATDPVGRTR